MATYRHYRRTLTPLLLGVLGALLLVSLPGEARSAPASDPHLWWLVEVGTIANRYDKSRVSMDIDAQGRTHVAYRGHDQLHYARITGSLVYTQVLPVVPHAVDYALAVDAGGQPHLAVIQSPNWSTGTLLYATQSGSTWLVEAISALSDIGYAGNTYSVALAMDASGKPHITYLESYSVQAYATETGNGWITRTVDANLHGSNGNSLALTAAGQPRITYSDPNYVAGTYTLKYAAWNGAGWDIETVMQSPDTEIKPVRLRLDSQGQPSILLFRGTQSPSVPTYAGRVGSSWMTETIPGPAASPWGDLALDAADRPHVVYAGLYGELGVFYGVRSGAAWEMELVTGPTFILVGAGAGMAMDAIRGQIRLGFEDCYYDKVYLAYYLNHPLLLPSIHRQ